MPWRHRWFSSALSAILALIGISLEISNYTNVWLSRFLLVAAAALFLVALLGPFAIRMARRVIGGRVRLQILPQVTDEDLRVREDLATFDRASGEPTLSNGIALLESIVRSGWMRSTEEQRFIASLIQGGIVDSYYAARAAVTNEITGVDGDHTSKAANLLELYGDLYVKYVAVANVIVQLGEVLNYPLDSEPAYEQWKEDHHDFLRRLRDLTARREFELLRARVRAAGRGLDVR